MTDIRLIALLTVLFTACQPSQITDHRDGEVYELLQVGDQTWMSENLRYMPAEATKSTRGGEDPVYGAYYSWDDAKTACPDGFHLPTLAEWMQRINTYPGSANPRGGRFVHQSTKDSTLLYGGMFNGGRLIAAGSMGLYWTATDSTNTFGVEGGDQQPAWLGIHIYGDYTAKDSVNVEPTWSNTKERLFNCKCIKD